MRRGVAIAALAAGFVATATLPAAAQGWGYAAWDEPVGGVGVSVGFGSPGYYGYAADYPAGYYARSGYAYGPGGCSCGPTAGYAGYGGGYAYQPGYAYSSGQPAYAYSSGQPAYAYSSGYAYEPGYAYGGSVGYRSYGYDSGPRYGWSGSRVAAGGEFRERTGTRNEIRSGGIAREQGVVRTGARAQAVGTDVRERGTSMRTGANVRSETGINQGRTGMSARGTNMRGGNAMGGEATVGRGGAATGGAPQPAGPGGRGEAIGGQGAAQPGMR
jgi:hypothetical protein